MRIAFVDITPWDYDTQTPYQRPLGGSQSALCYLAVELARLGHEVSLFNCVTQPRRVLGVQCLPVASVSASCWKQQDVVVVQNWADVGAEVKPLLRADCPLYLWTQHATDKPESRWLAEAPFRDAYTGFVFVSDWQRQTYHEQYQVEPARSQVLRNAIAPAFANRWPAGSSIVSAKHQPPRLAYTSTPFRGLDLLLQAFPEIRRPVPDVTLHVYSSMQVYQMAADADAAQFGKLYERCAATPGVHYVGSLPQPQLAEALQQVSLLAYPNHFPETSCISVMEAMACGCHVVTSQLGALPETLAGFGTLVPVDKGWQKYTHDFIATVVAVLQDLCTNPDQWNLKLREQVDFINRECIWSNRAHQWEIWLRTK